MNRATISRLDRTYRLSDLADVIDPTDAEITAAEYDTRRGVASVGPIASARSVWVGDSRYLRHDGRDAERFLDDVIRDAADGVDLVDIRRSLVVSERSYRSHRLNSIVIAARGWSDDRFSCRRERHEHRTVVAAIAILDERLRS